jgi:hypothetical protein
MAAQMRREAGRERKVAETDEERRVERRNRKLQRRVEDGKRKFEVKEPPKKKPPRMDMVRKKKFKELGGGVQPLIGPGGASAIAAGEGMAAEADEFAAGLASAAGNQFASAAARFEEAVVRGRPEVCKVFCPQLVALAATAPGAPLEDRIRDVEIRYGGKIGEATDRLLGRLTRASRIEEPTVRERAKRRAVKAAVTGMLRAYGKLREED